MKPLSQIIASAQQEFQEKCANTSCDAEQKPCPPCIDEILASLIPSILRERDAEIRVLVSNRIKEIERIQFTDHRDVHAARKKEAKKILSILTANEEKEEELLKS